MTAPKDHPNLTNAGLGRPAKNLKKILVPLSPELIKRLATISRQQGWDRNYLIEQCCRVALQMPADYNSGDLELIARGLYGE